MIKHKKFICSIFVVVFFVSNLVLEVDASATGRNFVWRFESNQWFLYNNGTKVTGWKKVNGLWYYLLSNGVMKTGWLKDKNKWYYLSSSGAMKTGWIKVKEKWYYLNPVMGDMRIGWLQDKGEVYYLNSNGDMKTGWLRDNGYWYYFYQNGAMAKGWIESLGKLYYLDPTNGKMVTGWRNIDNNMYYFNENGQKVANSVVDGFTADANGVIVDYKELSSTTLFRTNDERNMQGIAYNNGYYYIGYDVGNNNGTIVTYDSNGNKVDESGPLPIGHCSELAYRNMSSTLFVSNGGTSNYTHVYEVDMNTKSVIRELNYEFLGSSALIAIDNVKDQLILYTSLQGDNGDANITIVNLNNNEIIKTFPISNQGIPQGLEVLNDKIYLFTNNKITIFDINGNILDRYRLYNWGESQGMTIRDNNGKAEIVVGYNLYNRVYKIDTLFE